MTIAKTLPDQTDRARQQLQLWRAHFRQLIPSLLTTEAGAPQQLVAAMQYAINGPGKHMRPLLVYAAGTALDLPLAQLDSTACAIELIHAYSLVHDDLPAMDDDDFRRGRPSCHKAYDEATAILAGDALQAYAFELLSNAPELTGKPQTIVNLVNSLAQACGASGMAGGQMIDLHAAGGTLDLTALQDMHQRKTGALIHFAALAPALIAEAEPTIQDILSGYGKRIGLAFQIQDDILDVIGDPQVIGKQTQADARHQKPTFVSLLGLDGAKREALNLCMQARQLLEESDLTDADALIYLTEYVIQRNK